MTFDATVAGATANSYLTVAAADALAAADMGRARDAWVAVATTTDMKERSLQRATREVDAYLRSSGIARYSATQLRLYPRAVDVLNSTPYIPNAILFATYAQAKFLQAGGANLADAAAVRRAKGYQSASEPNVSYSNPSPLAPADEPLLCAEALGYLQGTFGRGSTIRSAVIGTPYTYPVVGDPGLDVLP